MEGHQRRGPHARTEGPHPGADKHLVFSSGGGTGFIGTALTQLLKARGHEVTLISRKPGPGSDHVGMSIFWRLGKKG